MRWRTIPGFKAYEVSWTGIVRRRLPGRGTYVGRVMTQCQSEQGRRYVCLAGGRKDQGRRFYAYKLVLLAFRGPPPTPRHEGAHRNGNCQDDRLGNLHWKTHIENMWDRDRHGTTAKGEGHHRAVLSEAKIATIRRRAKAGWKQDDIAARYGIGQPQVSRIVNKQRWRHVS